MNSKKIGDVEIRFIADGSLDEVILSRNGECLFHMEYMDVNHVWFGVGDIHVNLESSQPIRGWILRDSEPGEVRADSE